MNIKKEIYYFRLWVIIASCEKVCFTGAFKVKIDLSSTQEIKYDP